MGGLHGRDRRAGDRRDEDARLELAAEVTEFPVESGPAVTDHIRPVNGTLAIEGVISNTPIALPATQMNGVTQGATTVQVKGPGGAVKVTLRGLGRSTGAARATRSSLGSSRPGRPCV